MARDRLPLVGFTTYREDVTWGVRGGDAALTQAIYFELAAAAGGRPVLLPAVHTAPGGQAPNPHLGRIDSNRDLAESALLSAALEADLPVLAICRGAQLLNVVLGGTLYQHVPDVIGHDQHQPGDGRYAERRVECTPGTMTARIFGEHPSVQCSHHQAIDRVASDLVVTAWSVEDEGTAPLVEAVERPSSRFCLGVQWHPEKSADQRPFTALVDAC